MHAIIQSLCSLWQSSWQGMVMGELKYRKGSGGSGPYRVSASGRRIVRVSAVSPSGERMDLMLFPAAGLREADGRRLAVPTGIPFPPTRCGSTALLWGTTMKSTRPIAPL